MPKTVASPRPVPLPTSLVVKNGSKIRGRISGDMPLPSYARIHPMARLNAGQREQLSKWADQEARRLQPDAARP